MCPLARLYIREMNAVLQAAEESLSVFIIGSIELSVELHHWKNNPHMLDYENNFHRYKEIDLIPRSGKIDAEFMTGKTLCSSIIRSFSRQY